jgi:hypothetical protein
MNEHMKQFRMNPVSDAVFASLHSDKRAPVAVRLDAVVGRGFARGERNHSPSASSPAVFDAQL